MLAIILSSFFVYFNLAQSSFAVNSKVPSQSSTEDQNPANSISRSHNKGVEVPAPERSQSESKALFKLWASFKSPSRGESESIGGASGGCLQGGVALEQTEFLATSKKATQKQDYVIMKMNRHRFFGIPSLIQVIKSAGEFARKNNFSPILIGDMSQNRGGPMLSGHASHQTGLDVDIRYHLPQRNIKTSEIETLSAPTFVAKNNKIGSNWSSKQTQLLEFFAKNIEVDRIFVNPVIKKYLCDQTKNSEWLKKLRPWWGHHEHFHVRLRCPEKSKLCQTQDTLPEGSGCTGEDLAWWFSEEARQELEKRNQTPPGGKVFPQLPEACDRLSKE